MVDWDSLPCANTGSILQNYMYKCSFLATTYHMHVHGEEEGTTYTHPYNQNRHLHIALKIEHPKLSIGQSFEP